MNLLLWIVQIVLAVAFFSSGIMKCYLSEKQLVAKGQTALAGSSTGRIRFIGISEVMGAFGLVLPWWTGIWPVLTPVAAIGFAIVMLLAAQTHLRLREPKNIFVNILLLLIFLFIAWGRLQKR